jgi:uroporphyrinogen-III synthase
MLTMSKPANSKPLSKMRILVGRARHQAGALSVQLRTQGATVIETPFIEIRNPKSFQPLDSALKNIADYNWLILTSVNGVEALMQRMNKLHLGQRSLKGVRVAAIGPATKKAIEQGGIKVDVVPREYIAESVVRSLRRRIHGKRVLLVRAKVARDVIPHEMRLAGAEVDVVEAYETVVPAASRAALRSVLNNPRRRPHLVTFTSSSTVRNFVNLVGASKAQLCGVRFASIGPVTSATLRELGMRVDIEASEFTIPGLVKAIVTAAAALPRG